MGLTEYVNIGSGNDLVPSGNKPVIETMLTQIYVAKWHPCVGHMSRSMGSRIRAASNSNYRYLWFELQTFPIRHFQLNY